MTVDDTGPSRLRFVAVDLLLMLVAFLLLVVAAALIVAPEVMG